MTLLAKDAESEDIQIQMRLALAQLSSELWEQREQVLYLWHARVQNDDALDNSAQLSWNQFADHMPAFLRILCDRWSEWPTAHCIEERERETARAHSQYRWQQNYNLSALTREWGHFNTALLEVVDQIILDLSVALVGSKTDIPARSILSEAAMHSETTTYPTVTMRATHAWSLGRAGYLARSIAAQMLTESMTGSIAYYAELIQAEAAARGRELEAIVEQLRDQERERAQLLRQAAHDVRGSLVIVTGSASIINQENLPGDDRAQVHHLLQTGVRSLHDMMTDLIDLARLEAGEEQMQLHTFDVAQLLRELGETVRPLAQSHNLELRYDGEPELCVQGDEIKVRRIAQNLLLNAIYTTKEGHISLKWADHHPECWTLTVQDSGPGFPSTTSSDGIASHDGIEPYDNAADGHGRLLTSARPRSEGVGLTIVRRLCALMHGQMEIDSQPSIGSTFHILLPRHYNGYNEIGANK